MKQETVETTKAGAQPSFTPGPWKAHTDNGDEWDIFAHHAQEGSRLPAQTFGPNAEANAHLIAAAPELLEALNHIANLWPRNTTAQIEDVNGVNDGKSRAILLSSAIQIARNALVKAEGQS